MSYETGTATSQHDLLQKLAAWLVTQGWALDDSQADGSAWRAHLHKGGYYLHLRTQPTGAPFGFTNNNCTIPTLCLYMSTTYAGSGQPWKNSIVGAPVAPDGGVCGGGMVVNSGPNVAYHVFHDGSDHYTVVVERNVGLFNVIGWGLNCIKHGGNWQGGAYFHAQISTGNTLDVPLNDNAKCPFSYGTHEYPVSNGNSAFVRADVDDFVDNWVSCGASSTARLGWTGCRAYSTVRGTEDLPSTIPHTNALRAYAVSSINNQALLIPIRVFAATGQGGALLLCTIPSVYQCAAVDKGYLAGDEIQLGADTYKLFPEFAVKKVV